jgi:hypothetical protein
MAQANEKPTRDVEDIVAEAAKETDPEQLYNSSLEMQRALDRRASHIPKAARSSVFQLDTLDFAK